MNEGRDRGLWWHTSTIDATLRNVNRKKRAKPLHAKHLHPWEIVDRKRRMKARSQADNKFGFQVLKAAMVDRKPLEQIEQEFGV